MQKMPLRKLFAMEFSAALKHNGAVNALLNNLHNCTQHLIAPSLDSRILIMDLIRENEARDLHEAFQAMGVTQIAMCNGNDDEEEEEEEEVPYPHPPVYPDKEEESSDESEGEEDEMEE